MHAQRAYQALRHDAAQFTDPTTLTRHLLDERVLVEAPWPADGPLPVGLARSFVGEFGGDVASDVLPPGVSVERRRTDDGRAVRGRHGHPVLAAEAGDG